MTAAKVWRREDHSWTPPTLSFQIERHGGVVQGYGRLQFEARLKRRLTEYICRTGTVSAETGT
jgi:hypothetical protein